MRIETWERMIMRIETKEQMCVPVSQSWWKIEFDGNALRTDVIDVMACFLTNSDGSIHAWWRIRMYLGNRE